MADQWQPIKSPLNCAEPSSDYIKTFVDHFTKTPSGLIVSTSLLLLLPELAFINGAAGRWIANQGDLPPAWPCNTSASSLLLELRLQLQTSCYTTLNAETATRQEPRGDCGRLAGSSPFEPKALLHISMVIVSRL